MAKFWTNNRKGRLGEQRDDYVDALWQAFLDGADPADLRCGDGIWRQNPDQDRAADLTLFRDHVRLLTTGGQL